MLDLSRTRIDSSAEYPVLSTAPITYEGQALQYVQENGIGKVQASLGASNTAIMCGFSLYQNVSQTTTTQVDQVVVPSTAPYTATLTYTPASTTLVSGKATTGTFLTYNAAAGAGQFSFSGTTVTFNAAQAGLTVNMTYVYNMSANQAQMMFGSQPIGQTASAVLGSVSVIRRGDVYTDQFDPSVDWLSALTTTQVIQGGANGRVTLGNTGGTFAPPCRVIFAPTPTYPVLGLYIAL